MRSRFYIYYAIKSRPGPFIKQSIPSNITLDHNGKFELYVIINSIQVGLTDVANGSIIVVNCFRMISHRFFSIPSSSHKRMTLPLKSMAKHLWHQRKQTDGFGTNIWRNVIKCKHAAEEDLKGNIDRDHHLECLFPIKADAFETFLSGCLWYCKRPNYGVVILVTVKPDAFWLRGTGKNTGSGLSRNIKQFWRRHDRVNCWMNLSNSG